MTGSASPPSRAFRKTVGRTWPALLGFLLLAGAAAPSPAQMAFVASQEDRQLRVLDTIHDRVIRRVGTGFGADSVAAGIADRVFVFGSSVPRTVDVSIIDSDSGRRTLVSVAGPRGTIAAGPNRRSVYIGNESGVQAIDVATAAVVARYQRAAFVAGTLAVSPDGRTVAVGGDGVLLLDAATLKPLGRIADPVETGAIAWSPSGATLYAVDRTAAADDAVVEIDVARRRVARRIAVGRGAAGLAVARNGGRLYVTTTGGDLFGGEPTTPGVLVVVDVATGRVAARVPVGRAPATVALTPDGTKAYVVNGGSGTVSVVATGSARVTATIPVGGHPVAGVDFIGPAARR